MGLLERAACTVVSERAPGGVAACFLTQIWAQIVKKVGTQNQAENSIYSLKMELWEEKKNNKPNQGYEYCFRPPFVCRP